MDQVDNVIEDQKDSDEKNRKRKKEEVEELWEEIGFHKPLAGFWYNLVLNLINLLLGVVLSGVFLNIFYPFPESRGYIGIATGIFGVYFFIFDLGTNNVMTRFIAEARIKDTTLMVHYIQYFIWYQMITGIIQTTTVSIFALYFIPRTHLAYGVWMMLINATYQYPGFLGVFGQTLNSLQHFHRTAILGFIQGEVFQRITEGVFVVLGGMYGRAHPETGAILGIAYGAMIGTYLDNFLGTILGAHFFSKALSVQGISAKLCFRHEFTWEEIKPVMFFGLKTGIPGIIGGFTGLYVLSIQISYFPQYASYSSLVSLLGPMFWIIGSANPNVTALYTEAFLNGKKRLTQFYIGQSWRFTGILIGFFMSVFGIVYLFLPDAFEAMSLTYYFAVIPFILPYMFQKVLNLYIDEAGQLIYAANRVNYIFIMNTLNALINMIIMRFIVQDLQVQNTGLNGIIFVLLFAGALSGYLFTIIAFIYVQKTVIKLKIPWWQTFVAPFSSAAITFGLGYLAKITLYEWLKANYGFYVALIPMVILFLVLGVFVYFPLTAVLGGWDDDNYKDFDKVVKMSGPSKFIVVPMYKLTKFIGLKSPLHNKFRVDRTEAQKEAQELMEMKMRGEITMK